MRSSRAVSCSASSWRVACACRSGRPSRWRTHRFVALLTGAFVLLHVYTLLLDRYVHTSVVAVLVPGASAYRPFRVALGTVALELLAAVGVSNLLRKRIGYTRWRRIHYLTLVVWAAATVHGIGSGTDAGAGWLRVLYVCAVGSVAAAVAWRRLRPTPVPARRGPS